MDSKGIEDIMNILLKSTFDIHIFNCLPQLVNHRAFDFIIFSVITQTTIFVCVKMITLQLISSKYMEIYK